MPGEYLFTPRIVMRPPLHRRGGAGGGHKEENRHDVCAQHSMLQPHCNEWSKHRSTAVVAQSSGPGQRVSCCSSEQWAGVEGRLL